MKRLSGLARTVKMGQQNDNATCGPGVSADRPETYPLWNSYGCLAITARLGSPDANTHMPLESRKEPPRPRL